MPSYQLISKNESSQLTKKKTVCNEWTPTSLLHFQIYLYHGPSFLFASQLHGKAVLSPVQSRSLNCSLNAPSEPSNSCLLLVSFMHFLLHVFPLPTYKRTRLPLFLKKPKRIFSDLLFFSGYFSVFYIPLTPKSLETELTPSLISLPHHPYFFTIFCCLAPAHSSIHQFADSARTAVMTRPMHSTAHQWVPGGPSW